MRTGYALRPVSFYNTVHTDSFTATIIIVIEETFSQTWFSKRTSEIKIKTNKCKRTKNMKFIKHLN